MAASSPFRPRKNELPVREVGFVYLLVSTRDINACYVGETSKLRRRVLELNSGNGASFSNQSHLRPRGVMCFATGFSECPQSNRKERRHLEQNTHDNFFKKSTRSTVKDHLLKFFRFFCRAYQNKSPRSVVCAQL